MAEYCHNLTSLWIVEIGTFTNCDSSKVKDIIDANPNLVDLYISDINVTEELMAHLATRQIKDLSLIGCYKSNTYGSFHGWCSLLRCQTKAEDLS